MIQVILAFGSNLGDRSKNIQAAISELVFLKDLKVSKFYEYPALLPDAGAVEWDLPFLNAAAMGFTSLQPLELFKEIKTVEKKLGRDAQAPRWSPRIIDIDIIFYGDLVLSTPELTIPHPEMSKRLFVLEPVAEIAAGFNHPVLNITAQDLLLKSRFLD